MSLTGLSTIRTVSAEPSPSVMDEALLVWDSLGVEAMGGAEKLSFSAIESGFACYRLQRRVVCKL